MQHRKGAEELEAVNNCSTRGAPAVIGSDEKTDRREQNSKGVSKKITIVCFNCTHPRSPMLLQKEEEDGGEEWNM